MKVMRLGALLPLLLFLTASCASSNDGFIDNSAQECGPGQDVEISVGIDPPKAPTIPAAAKTSAQDHTTVPPRAWLERLIAALAATAIALVPIATWGSGTPTTYTISGTARIDPPPPTRPSENPTSAPDASPSTPCATDMIKMKDSMARRDHRRIFHVLLCR